MNLTIKWLRPFFFTQRASVSFFWSLCGCSCHSAGTSPYLMRVFYSRLLRCSGTGQMLASKSYPWRANKSSWSRYRSNLWNSLSMIFLFESVSRNYQRLFAPGSVSSKSRSRKPMNDKRYLIWSSVWSSLNLYRLCNTRTLNIKIQS